MVSIMLYSFCLFFFLRPSFISMFMICVWLLLHTFRQFAKGCVCTQILGRLQQPLCGEQDNRAEEHEGPD